MALPTPLQLESFGQFTSELTENNLCVKIDFPAELVKERRFWPNSYLSANYISEYLSIFFPTDQDQPEQLKRCLEITDATRYIANELLENAFKFSCTAAQHPVQMALYHYPDRLIITVSNTAHINDFIPFRSLIHDLTTLDPHDLYVDRLEQNLDQEQAFNSGLGFITILINYNTKLGWKIEPHSQESDCFGVTTMAQLLYE